MTTDDLPGALAALRERVAAVRLGLQIPGAADARRERTELVGQIDDYLLPRLRQLDAPLLAVVGGSTGSGKSTLVNTLVGDDVTLAGVLRPTTRSPVLVCHPDDIEWFADDRILPGMARITGASSDDPRSLRLVPHTSVPAGLALLDAPDIDSVVAENRELAAQLLAAADLWLFLTTAARYADAVPWDLLHTAAQRSTALAVVLNRTPPEAARQVTDHFRGMLTENGLSRATLFTVEEQELAGGRIPAGSVAPLHDWLDGLGRDALARAEIVWTTLDGALASMQTRVPALSGHVDEQLAAASALVGASGDRYAAAYREVDDGIRGGTILRGEVLARWHEFVGTGGLTRTLEAKFGRFRDRVTALLMGRPAPSIAVEKAVESSLESLVRAAADRAAEQTTEAWRARSAGTALLSGRRALTSSSPEFETLLRAEVRAWQGRMLKLVTEEGGQKRTAARLTSFGVNGAGLVMMLAVFAQTGGLTGLEVLIAGGTTAVNQKLLETVFGDAAVRTLAARARDDLLDRVESLLAGERRRFDDLVAAEAPEPHAGADVRKALVDFERARRTFRAAGRQAGADR